MLATPPSVAPPQAGRAIQAVLPLKLTPPPLRAAALLRPDLQALLSEVRTAPLTLLVAPAGYGKTTLLTQWVGELTRTGAPVCWLSLDTSERDPALLLTYLIHSIQQTFPEVGAEALRMLQSLPNLDRDWPLVAGALCSDLQRRVLTSAFLVLDDLQLISDSALAGQVLGYMLRAAPPALHIVMAARRMPTFAPLARLRTEARVFDVGQRALHLTESDLRQILSLYDVVLSPAELSLLLERTAGWALSVQLAARALAAQPAERRGAFVRALGGSQEQLITYLSTEVLAELPVHLIEFLRLAALPISFDAALLNQALERDDSDYLLGRAQALGLPLQPTDKGGGRLHFHPLWRELLLRGLLATTTETQLAELHCRFGRVLETRGALEAALDHYASAQASDDLARALRERAWPLLRSPRRDSMRRWLEQLPASARERDPDLLYMWGASQVAANPDSAALEIERAAALYQQAGQPERELAALADLALILTWQARSAKLAGVCVRAVRATRHLRNDPWSRGAALVGVVVMLAGQARALAALRVAHHATTLPLTPAWRWLLAMTTATLTCQLGRPDEALAAIDEALQLQQVDHDDRLRQNLLGLRGVALFQRGQLAEGTTLCLEAHRHVSDYYQGGIAGSSAARLALLLMLQGRVDEAMTYLAQARAAFHLLGALAPLADLQAIEIYGQLLRGQRSNACAAVNSVLRRLREHQSNAPDLRIWLLLAVVLGEGDATRRALDLARETVSQMEVRGYRLFLASARLYTAYLAGLCGDEPTREAELRAGWELVAADDHVYLPLLPEQALCDVAIAALRSGLVPAAVGMVLRRRTPAPMIGLLLGLLSEPAPKVRAAAARLLGELSAASSYSALRALIKDRDAGVRQAAEMALSQLVYRPPYTLHIRTLGAFEVRRGDLEVRDRDWRSSKARQLFQFLLTERGRTVPREHILEILWPDMTPEIGANNLRVTLNRLAKALEPDRPDGAPPSYTLQHGETFSFNLNVDFEIDAAEFAAAVADGQRAELRGQRQAAIAAFRRAITLYGGPYLPDNLYEDWSAVERERLAMLFADAAMSLGALLLDDGQPHEAIGLGWRVLETDQTNEAAYRLLMRAHAYLGERNTALKLYTRCQTALQHELGVEPLPETVALYHVLRDMR